MGKITIIKVSKETETGGKDMKFKKLMAVLLTGCMVFSLTACGGNDSKEKTTDNPSIGQ